MTSSNAKEIVSELDTGEGKFEMSNVMKEALSVKTKTVSPEKRVERFEKIANMDFSKIGVAVSVTYVGLHL